MAKIRHKFKDPYLLILVDEEHSTKTAGRAKELWGRFMDKQGHWG